MRAIRELWTATSRLYDRGDEGHAERKVLDCSIGWQNYKDASGVWREANAGYSEADGDGFNARFTRVPRLVRLGDDGRKRIYLVPGNDSVWVQLYKPSELPLGTPTSKVGGVWTWDSPFYTFELIVSPSAVKFKLTLKRAVGVNTLHIPFEAQGLTRQGPELLHNGEVVALLRRPTVTHAGMAEGEEPLPVDVYLGVGEIVLSFDPGGMQYPIVIDPPVDLQVGASGDDGRRYTGNKGFSSTEAYSYLGYYDNVQYRACHNFARWTGATLLGIITVAYMQIYIYSGDAGSPTVALRGVDQDNPPAPTSAAQFDAAPLTTASVPWNGNWTAQAWNTSPSLVSIFQELVDSYTINNEAVMVQIKDTKGAGFNTHLPYFWDALPIGTLGPKLHIEYNEAGAGPPGVAAVSLVAAANIGKVQKVDWSGIAKVDEVA